MAFATINYHSESLQKASSFNVIFPGSAKIERPWAVFYLLHGLSDDHTAWLRYTAIERYAGPLAVVMPAVGRSFYADEAHGHRYWEYVSEELPRLVARFFRVSQEPEDTFVAGLSMGGYGALKLALTHPERYAAAASLSGALDVVGLAEHGGRDELFQRVYDGAPGPDDDLFDLLERAEGVPPLHVSCGTEDALLDSNERFAAAVEARGVDVTTDFRAGEHEWGLWDAVIRDVIAWLPIRS